MEALGQETSNPEEMFYATLQVTNTPIMGFLSLHTIDFTNY